MSIGRSLGKRLRTNLIETFWINPCHPELTVLDRGDHIKVTACSSDVSTWWLGRLRAVYPQDHLSGDNQIVKMHPEAGVTLQLNRDDGTLKIRGRNHLQWFEKNFRVIVEGGSKELTNTVSTSRVVDHYLRMDDDHSVSSLLRHLPSTGAIKHGPSFIYRLWKALLDVWIATADDVYIITPFIDAKRLADAIMLLAKHRLSSSRLHVFTASHCDGEDKFSRVLKDAKDMLRELKAPNKKRLWCEERLNAALARFEAKFGRFRCKLIAMCHGGHGKVMVTSASFHRCSFEVDSSDSLAYFSLASQDLVSQYLSPLGLEHQATIEDHEEATLSGAMGSSSTSSFRTDSGGVQSGRPDSFGSDS